MPSVLTCWVCGPEAEVTLMLRAEERLAGSAATSATVLSMALASELVM